ncbi:MAG TPA: glycoside hydrolase family 2 TIM barrel-domain containing protein [Candidatus Paceibacterota bacterium]|nr:glycoside hydrolase family 2 TIM barrel-domain containing protein [Candidatus Paceibacterota bacterium]
MKRREFIKMSLSAAALAAVPSCVTKLPRSGEAGSAPGGALTGGSGARAPRRSELLDFDWRFKPVPVVNLQDAVTVNQWVWTREQSGQTAEQMASPDLDTSGPDWNKTDTGNASTNHGQMDYVGYAWFRTSLPELTGPGRTISFIEVDDNAEVYLNGKLVDSHQGYSSSFMMNLDPAWKAGGPNVLAVRVQNTAGPGGIYGDVQLGRLPVSEQFFARDLDDRSWREVQLPHDYIVEGDYSSKADTGHGSLPVFPAWYRRKFSLKPADAGKCVWLYFEGVFRDAKIYVNGKMVSRHPGGYTSFHVDLTDAVRFDAENLLAVYVDPVDFEGWWYEGGGIYRHVWLNVADPVHVAPWGVYVTSEVADVTGAPSAKLRVETMVANRTADTQDCSVVSTVLDPDGRVVGTATDNLAAAPSPVPADARKKILTSSDMDQPSGLHTGTTLVQQINLSSARLWSLEKRNRYTVVTEVSRDGKVVDRHAQKFGIRTLRFDPNDGFFLNEKPVKLNGVCNHQDFVGVGIGMVDSLLYYRMKRLQEFGCNAIRCSHNPMTPAMYEACDELGLLVMDENRHPGSSVAGKSWVGQLYDDTWHTESMVLRDRNHPSVIMWSMWNEESAIHNTPFGREMMAALIQTVHKHDQTRPVTCANNSGAARQAWRGGVADAEDLLGVNYNSQDYDILHLEYPAKMVFGSEIGSNTECRGVYQTDRVAAHQTSYMAPDGSWEPLGSRKFVAGGFYWTGFDYRGETTPFNWPEINSNFGFLDMCGFPKDMAFYWKAWWQKDQPLVHIFPHWNWPGKEGQNVPVWCFSNCDEVELFLNGRSLGKKSMPEFRHLQWNEVAYAPGRLEAVGYIKGQIAARKVVETTGAPAAIKLIPDRTRLLADGQDTVPIAVAVVDAQGRVVPTADNKISFDVSGSGTNAGVGNGDPSCHEPNQAGYRSAFCGYCMVLAQAARTTGALRVTARSPGLSDATVQLAVRKS